MYKEGRLSYADFVWFLISEEDKKTDTRYIHLVFVPDTEIIVIVCFQD